MKYEIEMPFIYSHSHTKKNSKIIKIKIYSLSLL